MIFWVIHGVGGSEPIHLNMQIIFERTSIQMIKFEKRKKGKKKKVPHWKKNAHLHHLMYIIFMCHLTIGCWGDLKFWPKKKRGASGGFFLHFSFVPNKFPLGSHQIPNTFPRFPMCSQCVFLVAVHFNPICFAQSPPPLLSPIYSWAKGWCHYIFA
jgi:hypothetical protein